MLSKALKLGAKDILPKPVDHDVLLAKLRMLSSRRAPGLPQSLEQAAADGFEFVRLYVEPDETTVLVERTVGAGTAP